MSRYDSRSERSDPNSDWITRDLGAAQVKSVEHAIIATLMDVRQELRDLNRLLNCPNALSIPTELRAIRRKLPTPKPKKKASR